MYGVAIDSRERRDQRRNQALQFPRFHLAINIAVPHSASFLPPRRRAIMPMESATEGGKLFIHGEAGCKWSLPPFSPSPLPDMTYIFFRSSSTHGRASTGPPERHPLPIVSSLSRPFEDPRAAMQRIHICFCRLCADKCTSTECCHRDSLKMHLLLGRC